MDACQHAVPAWIMPTYRVAEAISPRPHAYDVVIVDDHERIFVDESFAHHLDRSVGHITSRACVDERRQASPGGG